MLKFIKEKLISYSPFLIILLFGFFLIINLRSPSRMVVDETYYAPAGREILNTNEEPNLEHHPPLSKYLIGLGIKLNGFTPLGWRFTPIIAGLTSLITTYFLALSLTKNKKIALLSIFLLSFEFLYFSMSRNAMLDIFVTTFILFTTLFTWKYLETQKKKFLILIAISYGLALSAKWTTGLIFPLLFFTFLEKNQDQKITLKNKSKIIKNSIALILGILLIYLLPYLPYLFKNGPWEIFTLQLKIFRNMASVNQYQDAHTSPLSTFFWPLAPTNSLSSYELYGNYKATFSLLANPLILWSFLPLFFYHLIYSLKKKSLARFFILTIIICLYVPWLVIDRVRYFYYMLPIMPFLCILIPLFINDLFHFSSFEKITFQKPKLKANPDFLDKILYFWDNLNFKIKSSKLNLKSKNFIEKLITNKKLILILRNSYLLLILIFFILYYPILNGIPISPTYQKAITFFWPFLNK